MSVDRSEDTGGTERLLDALVEDASPVAPIYPMGRVALGVLGMYVAWWLGSIWMLGGARDAASLFEIVTDGFFVGLAVSVAGVTGAGLASREPGRDEMARGAIAVASIGVVAMIATFFVRLDESAGGVTLGMGLKCAAHAALLGLVPAGVLLFVSLGGWRGRPVVTSLAAAASGAALGGIAVHVACPSQGVWHVLLGHVFYPLLAAIVLGAFGAVVWRRWLRS